MRINSPVRQIKTKIHEALHSSRGKDVLLYLLFVCVAFVFWLMLSLDTEIQRDYDIPIIIENIPDSVTFISNTPPTVNAGVTAKGSQLIKYHWGHIPPIKFNFEDYIKDDALWVVNSAKMESRVRDYFGNSIIVNNIRPDSLHLQFTNLPGELIALTIHADVQPNMQCIISGSIKANVDSIMVYSATPIPHTLKTISTDPIILRNIKDTTYVETRLSPIEGIRFIPDKVRVMIPVEPLISKREQVRISVLNLPDNIGIITFPSLINVSYLVPMSRYNEDYPVKAVVDFKDLNPNESKLPVRISLLPQFISSISTDPDSVEFIIERH